MADITPQSQEVQRVWNKIEMKKQIPSQCDIQKEHQRQLENLGKS